MATATEKRSPKVAVVDDHAEGPAVMTGGGQLSDFIDEASLEGQQRKAVERNRATTRPFRQYQKKVIELADIPNTHETRQMTSNICGMVARLSFVPDDEIQVGVNPDGSKQTEFDQQVIRTAEGAEAQLGSEKVWTTAARKLARAALDLRKQDPYGEKGIAWVNDTLEDEAGVLDD